MGGELDLDGVRCFTVVAEHLHFGRAAEALHLAQPALSRRIRRLEDHLGARLFDRDTRGTRLTAAGEAFLPEAHRVLSAAHTATAAARAAAGPERLTVGHVAALLVTPAVRAMREAHPHVDVRTRHLAWHEPRTALLERRVDVAVARLPISGDGVRVRRLYDEPRVLLVARDHRLADRDRVRLADIADEPVARLRDADPDWAAFWRVDPRPDGRPAPPGPVVDTPEDRLEAVAQGDAVALATGSIRHGALRSDLVAVAVEDLEPVTVAAVTLAGERRALVREFLRLAVALRPVSGCPCPGTDTHSRGEAHR